MDHMEPFRVDKKFDVAATVTALHGAASDRMERPGVEIATFDGKLDFLIEPDVKAEQLVDLAGYVEGFASSFNKIINTMNDLSPREQRKVIHKLRRELRQEDREIKILDDRKELLGRAIRATEEVDAWLKQPLRLEAPAATKFHDVREVMKDGTALIPKIIVYGNGETAQETARLDEMWADASVYLVEHDWAAAFRGAADYSFGEFKLPDDVCVFEFKIGGRHVIVCIGTSNEAGDVEFFPIFWTSVGWLFSETIYRVLDDGTWGVEKSSADDEAVKPLMDVVYAQIRAVAIALDAEVAASEVVRAPHKLNHARERRGKLPINSYHVVSLSRRSRAPRLERDPNPEPTSRKRLHFRRGHWRHYENHKTWIRWMLVGDPDLGFVDKHYRL